MHRPDRGFLFFVSIEKAPSSPSHKGQLTRGLFPHQNKSFVGPTTGPALILRDFPLCVKPLTFLEER